MKRESIVQIGWLASISRVFFGFSAIVGVITTMAYVTQNRSGRWEIRESRSTPDGPRSRTLATFERLGHVHLTLAASRASGEFVPEAVTDAARRAGAPVELGPADDAAISLLRAVGDGETVSPGLRSLLLDALGKASPRPSTEEALGHVGKTAEERGADLIDLLLLTDALPDRSRASKLKFPVIPDSRG
jgi:hypothetical protein